MVKNGRVLVAASEASNVCISNSAITEETVWRLVVERIGAGNRKYITNCRTGLQDSGRVVER